MRETMNEMVEAWKEIPDVVVDDEFLQTPEHRTSSRGIEYILFFSFFNIYAHI